jgi:hypothetical protein
MLHQPDYQRNPVASGDIRKTCNFKALNQVLSTKRSDSMSGRVRFRPLTASIRWGYCGGIKRTGGRMLLLRTPKPYPQKHGQCRNGTP